RAIADAVKKEDFDILKDDVARRIARSIFVIRELKADFAELSDDDMFLQEMLGKTKIPGAEILKVSSPVIFGQIDGLVCGHSENFSIPVSSPLGSDIKAEARARHDYEWVVKNNLRLIELTALRKRLEVKNNELLFFADAADEKEWQAIRNELKRIRLSLIRRFPPGAAEFVEGSDLLIQAKGKLLEAAGFIEENNEPAANALLVSAAQDFYKRWLMLMNAGQSVYEEEDNIGFNEEKGAFYFRRGIRTNQIIGKGKSEVYRSVKPVYFKLLWNIRSSLKETLRSNISNLEELRKIYKTIWEITVYLDGEIAKLSEADKRRGKQPVIPSEESRQIKESLAVCLEWFKNKKAGFSKITRDAGLQPASELFEAGEFRYCRQILGAALVYIQLRGQDIAGILKGVLRQLGLVQDYINAQRNSKFLHRLNDILEVLNKDNDNMLQAYGMVMGMLKKGDFQRYYSDPEFWHFKQFLGYAGELLNGKHAGDKEENRKHSKEILLGLKQQVEDAQYLNQLHYKFWNLQVFRHLARKPLSEPEGFVDVFEKFLKKANLVRGAPPGRSRILRDKFNRLLSIHQTIPDPKHKYQRLINPVFKAATYLIILKEIYHFSAIARYVKKELPTAVMLLGQFAANEKTNYWQLSRGEDGGRAQLFHAVVSDLGLPAEDFHLLFAPGIKQPENCSSPVKNKILAADIVNSIQIALDSPTYNNLKEALLKIDAIINEEDSILAIPELISSLAAASQYIAFDEIGRGRENFISALIKVGSDSSEVEVILAKLLTGDPSEYIRSAAARALAYGLTIPYAPATVEALRKGIQDIYSYITVPCEKALAKHARSASSPVVADGIEIKEMGRDYPNNNEIYQQISRINRLVGMSWYGPYVNLWLGDGQAKKYLALKDGIVAGYSILGVWPRYVSDILPWNSTSIAKAYNAFKAKVISGLSAYSDSIWYGRILNLLFGFSAIAKNQVCMYLIAVMPSEQSKGIGTALLKRMFDYVVSNRIVRTTTNSSNKNAIRSLKKLMQLYPLKGRFIPVGQGEVKVEFLLDQNKIPPIVNSSEDKQPGSPSASSSLVPDQTIMLLVILMPIIHELSHIVTAKVVGLHPKIRIIFGNDLSKYMDSTETALLRYSGTQRLYFQVYFSEKEVDIRKETLFRLAGVVTDLALIVISGVFLLSALSAARTMFFVTAIVNMALNFSSHNAEHKAFCSDAVFLKKFGSLRSNASSPVESKKNETIFTGRYVLAPSILNVPSELRLNKAIEALKIGRGKSIPVIVHFDVIDSNNGSGSKIVQPGAKDTMEELNPHLLGRIIEEAPEGILVDVHQMVMEPSVSFIDTYIKQGAGIITLHWEAFEDKEVLLERLRLIKEAGRI
ncbi:MAG: GNAT family N-acetyltransferase, partial [Candidatus Omnitrophica bacterium]|nr:GNAT family N-acetyltransferase [Candidatus Omnitrophota bacterium]